MNKHWFIDQNKDGSWDVWVQDELLSMKIASNLADRELAFRTAEWLFDRKPHPVARGEPIEGCKGEEGDICPDCLKGRFEYARKGECCCHIAPPCSACTDSVLKCNVCGLLPDEIGIIKWFKTKEV